MPTIEITFGALRVGHVDLHLQVDRKTKPSRLLPSIGDRLRVEVVRLATSLSDQLSVRIDVGTISAA